VAARDHLSPDQFGGRFDPEAADYSGTAYAYKAGGKQLGARAASSLGQFHAHDVSLRLPTGSTTDHEARWASGGKFAEPLKSFSPNTNQYPN